jgi:hypothetical protein
MRSCHNESTAKISRENGANQFLLPCSLILIWEFLFHLKKNLPGHGYINCAHGDFLIR